MLATDRSDYFFATSGSVFLHLALLAGVLIYAPATNDFRPIPDRGIIQAQLVSLDDLKPPEPEPQQRIIDLTKAPPAAEVAPPEPLQMPTEEPQPAPEVTEEPEAEDPVEIANTAAEVQAEREQQELIQRQADLSAQLDAEMGALEDIENQQIVMSYAGWISERVGNSWSRPPSARSGMIVKLRVNLVPTGRVVSVDIVESSGDDAFDRSAVQAVHKAEPYSRLTELDSELFDEQFRQFVFIFNPQDLRL
jgi:TonB family protein